MNGTPDDSTARALHRLLEHYTPDGTLGRTLLGVTALVLAPPLFFGGIGTVNTAATFASFVTGLFGTAVGAPAFVLGVVVLWPVYLSLIGNVESPAAYPKGSTARAEAVETPEDILKRRYASGEISRDEFERYLDDVIDPSRRGARERDDDERREPSANR